MKPFLPAAAALFLAGCGYVGDPRPPLANIPPRVADLAALQRGDRVIVQCTFPVLTTEGHPIPPPIRLDLRAGPADPFNEPQWAAAARQIPPGAIAQGIARYEIPITGWTGKEVIFGVRTLAGNGKHSGWSNFVILPVVAPPEKPAALTPSTVPGGVHLAWQARGIAFRVFRKSGDAPYTSVADVQAPEWTDPGTEFGTSYTYAVQTIALLGNQLGSQKHAESELSEAATIVPRNIFPPAAPHGVQASAAPNSIEVNWERNTEEDLNGYRVYRGEGNSPLEKIADVSVVPSYSDRKVTPGKTYRYAITALDRAGNESPRSAPVEAVIP